MTKKTRFLSYWAIASAAIIVLGMNAFGQTSTSFKVAGPCVSCGAAYLEGVAMKISGVSKASYNMENFMLSLQYDAGSASELDIQLELSLKGFDAGSFSHDADAVLPACARSGMSRGDEESMGMMDLEEDDAISDWESPQNLAELEALGRRGDDDAEISDEVILNDEIEEDGEELMNWEAVNEFEVEDELEDGNPWF